MKTKLLILLASFAFVFSAHSVFAVSQAFPFSVATGRGSFTASTTQGWYWYDSTGWLNVQMSGIKQCSIGTYASQALAVVGSGTSLGQSYFMSRKEWPIWNRSYVQNYGIGCLTASSTNLLSDGISYDSIYRFSTSTWQYVLIHGATSVSTDGQTGQAINATSTLTIGWQSDASWNPVASGLSMYAPIYNGNDVIIPQSYFTNVALSSSYINSGGVPTVATTSNIMFNVSLYNVDSDSIRVLLTNNDTGFQYTPFVLALSQTGQQTVYQNVGTLQVGGYSLKYQFCKSGVCGGTNTFYSNIVVVGSQYYGQSLANATTSVPQFSVLGASLGCTDTSNLFTVALCKALVPDDAVGGLYANSIARIQSAPPFSWSAQLQTKFNVIASTSPSAVATGSISFLGANYVFWNPTTFDSYMGSSAESQLKAVTGGFLLFTALMYLWWRMRSLVMKIRGGGGDDDEDSGIEKPIRRM